MIRRTALLGIATILLVMAGYAGYKESKGLFFTIGIALWCTWLPLLLAYFLVKQQNMASVSAYSALGAFLLIAFFTLRLLSVIDHAVFSDGSLKEGALIYVVIPIWWPICGGGGWLLGRLIWLALGKRNQA